MRPKKRSHKTEKGHSTSTSYRFSAKLKQADTEHTVHDTVSVEE